MIYIFSPFGLLYSFSVGTLEIRLFGDDFEQLIDISNDFRREFEKIPNFVDIGSTYTGGVPQARIEIDRTKEIDVTVRLEESRRNTLQDILELEIPSKYGAIKLKEETDINFTAIVIPIEEMI